LNRIWINFYSTKFNFNLIAYNHDSIEKNWDIPCWRRYSIHSFAYSIGQESFKKTQIQNTPVHASSIEKGLNEFHFGIVQSMIMTTFETLSCPIYTSSEEYCLWNSDWWIIVTRIQTDIKIVVRYNSRSIKVLDAPPFIKNHTYWESIDQPLTPTIWKAISPQ
jgi:hypothetical protein